MIETSPIELNAQFAVQQVRDLLPTQEVGGITLRIMEEYVYSQHDFWHVPVRPNADPCNLSELVETLAEIEVTLQLDYGLNIMIDLVDPEPEDGGAETENSQPEFASASAA